MTILQDVVDPDMESLGGPGLAIIQRLIDRPDLQFAGSLEPGDEQVWRLVEKGNRSAPPIYISLASLLRLVGTKLDIVTGGQRCWLKESKSETDRLAKQVNTQTVLFLNNPQFPVHTESGT